MAVGNIVRLMTRAGYALINTCRTWHQYVALDAQTLQEFQFWLENIDNLNCKQSWPTCEIPSKVVYSDASEEACGAILKIQEKIFHCNWSEREREESSTWRELKAVELGLSAFKTTLSNSTIAWFTDSQNVASIVTKGSRNSVLQGLAMQIFALCLIFKINLNVSWIPRELNTQADVISRIVDYDDYTLNDQLFDMLNQRWGPYTIDRFACYYNAKLARFNSRFFQPGTEAVDAFTQHWGRENNWLFPPTVIITKVIRHLRICNAEGTLIIPLWKSAAFWPMLSEDGVHWNPWVHEWRVLEGNGHIIIKGKANNCIFTKPRLNFDIVALRISFCRKLRPNKAGFCTTVTGQCKECNGV